MTSGQYRFDPEQPIVPRDFISPCLLLLLADQPAYGYQLLEELAHWGIAKDTGTIYRALHELERAALISAEIEPSDSGPRRRRYHIEPLGQVELGRWCERLATLQRLVDEFITHYWSSVGRGAIEFRGVPQIRVASNCEGAEDGPYFDEAPAG